MILETQNDLFDIVHQNALNFIYTEEDELFLMRQREKSRPGSMLGIDFKLLNKEETRKII